MNIEAELSKLEVKPGDILLLKVKRAVSSEEYYRLQRLVERALPPGIKVFVLEDGAELEKAGVIGI